MGSAKSRLLDAEEASYLERERSSLAALRAHLGVLPLGVASSYEHHYPFPPVIRRQHGASVVTADGTELLDLHLGFGVSIAGHADERIVAAARRALDDGMLHAGYPTARAHRVAALICDRLGQDTLRFSPSGTEAVMDAVRLARHHTGRDLVLRIEGAYHGHSEEMMVSAKPDTASVQAGPVAPVRDDLFARPDRVLVCAWNDAATLRTICAEHGEQIAAIISEPVLANAGMIMPAPGWHRALRAAADLAGAVLIFDEIKTGLVCWDAHPGWEVRPDLVVFGKAFGGGLPLCGFAGRHDLFDGIREMTMFHGGTFTANPVALAASEALLTEVLVPGAWQAAADATSGLAAQLRERMFARRLPWHVTHLGLKLAVLPGGEPYLRYADWLHADRSANQLFWLFAFNRGVLTSPGSDEQMTISLPASRPDRMTRAHEVLRSWLDVVSELHNER